MPIRRGVRPRFDCMTPRNVELIRAMYPNIADGKTSTFRAVTVVLTIREDHVVLRKGEKIQASAITRYCIAP